MAKILLTFLSGAVGRLVTIHNDKPLLDVDGNYVDAHDGMILEHDQTYFLYGEAYGNQTLATQYPWHDWPRLAVYTSQDMVSWTYGGPMLTREQVGGTLWIPNVFYHEPTKRFVLWYGAGDWGTATSTDGVHFELHEPHHTSRLGGSTDGTGIFIDDDGAGYVIFAASPAGVPTKLGQGHVVSIERLTSDLLESSKVNVSDYFPDDYVESPALFKRKGWYYVTYGSCCCGCAEGGGQVVHKARSVLGPWVRQSHADINCRDASAAVCGGFGRRSEQLKDLVYNAQWWGASVIPSADPIAEPAIVYTGRRWLSGPSLPAGCNDICGNRGHPKKCLVGGEKFEMRRDYSVWYPLEFDDATGDIKPMQPLSSFQLDIPGDDPVPSPTPPPIVA